MLHTSKNEKRKSVSLTEQVKVSLSVSARTITHSLLRKVRTSSGKDNNAFHIFQGLCQASNLRPVLCCNGSAILSLGVLFGTTLSGGSRRPHFVDPLLHILFLQFPINSISKSVRHCQAFHVFCATLHPFWNHVSALP
jgi:hypothetical protein